MTTALVAVDTGATNTRIAVGNSGTSVGAATRTEHRVSSAPELREAISNAVAELGGDRRVLVGGFAGAVLDDRVEITNWTEDRVVSGSDLRSIGFAETHLLNDLEAAAHGLVDLLAEVRGGGEPDGGIVPLTDTPFDPDGNRVLIMPGTGLGSAGLVTHTDGWRIVPGETQHARATAYSDTSAALLTRAGASLGFDPSWDDLVSGRGLELIHRLCGGEALTAFEVASRGRDGDETARSAVEAFYGFAGHFAQVMALAFKATGGVYLAGSTTAANLDLCRAGAFADGVQGNRAMGHLLERVPVYAVTAELNLRGAWAFGSASM